MKLLFSKIAPVFAMGTALISCDSASDPAKKSNITPIPPAPVALAAPPKNKTEAPKTESSNKDKAKEITLDIIDLGIDLLTKEDKKEGA
ncbi:hypothetical protein Q7M76_03935 [Candidatus Liberibacter asiaticus]|uniref:Lipoprotein n=2 Tax=Liberibacter asiaticus TaxID=34021 RepID=C6XG77_LIBAP|nr:hypothetical protein [Candidatus Liberibacter asiaticus]ACT57380.1 hypothetical protein CLIBASIA_04030 [Candidatus Liberibacter asiaticus str. psy62]AGH17143.1 hypothetical protein WSI_03865 [Candidatus Liberibacter asiaticus str. gxpsy]ALK07452.1 hypothetical protein CD16_03950 [Candidatus Liberibacter asiaticus]ASK52944.1 hypothetical protein B2I23_04005 [Candidatus Liberibacter asiaticus]AWL14266.1 hypothetical protein DIC79_04030 [Candidatus Liberibacter asiaticus]